MRKDITVNLSGIPIRYLLQTEGTESYFEGYRCAENAEAPQIIVTEDIWKRHKLVADDSPSVAYTEFYSLLGSTCRVLLNYDRFLFHGVAFIWHGKAWIITAPSGTGKTTQYLLWKKYFGNEIELINGDKPIVEYRKNGSFMVHPSPWNGKESYAGNVSAQLAGIIYLEQAKENRMERMSSREAVVPIYRQFLYYGDYKEEILAVGKQEERILKNIPIWKLSNLGDEASARLTHSVMEEYVKNEKL